MGKLDGRVAIVTGASRGIGEAIAKLFANEGAKVVCAARTLHEGDHKQLPGSLDTTVKAIVAAGGQAAAVQCDVSVEADCQRLMEETKRLYGPADILVNDAALNLFRPIVDYPVSRWVRTFAVNVHGPFMLCKLALPDMIARRRGAIVNISSGGAIGPGRGPYKNVRGLHEITYASTKAALERFSQGLAEEVYEHGICVTALAPSQSVPTPGRVAFSGALGTVDSSRSEPPEMMARAALLLVSEPLDKVTGRVTYSQAILKEFGWIKEGKGAGVDRPGSGFSQI